MGRSSRARLVWIVGLGLGRPTATAGTTAGTTATATATATGLMLSFAPGAILGLELRLPGIGRRRLAARPITGCSLNFQLVQLVPFSIGAITVWYGKQLAHPAPRIKSRRSGRRRGVDFVLQGIPVQSI
jgi:hypothetical protein